MEGVKPTLDACVVAAGTLAELALLCVKEAEKHEPGSAEYMEARREGELYNDAGHEIMRRVNPPV